MEYFHSTSTQVRMVHNYMSAISVGGCCFFNLNDCGVLEKLLLNSGLGGGFGGGGGCV